MGEGSTVDECFFWVSNNTVDSMGFSGTPNNGTPLW